MSKSVWRVRPKLQHMSTSMKRYKEIWCKSVSSLKCRVGIVKDLFFQSKFKGRLGSC